MSRGLVSIFLSPKQSINNWQARELVLQSDGLEQTRALAEDYASSAIDAISAFPDSQAKDGLIEMAVKTLKRRK